MKHLLFCLWAGLIFLGTPLTGVAKQLEAHLFTAPWCPHCQHLKKDGFIQSFREKYKGQIVLHDYDITQGTNNILFQEKIKNHPGAKPGIPALFIEDELLQGYPGDIGTKTDETVQKILAKYPVATPQELAPVLTTSPEEQLAPSALAQHEEFFNQITLWTIIGAGLVDGINPCAFAVIVFFVSFLAAYKYNKKEILVVGTAYCSAVFLAYVLMGLGVFRVLYALEGFRTVAVVIQWGIVALCALFFVLCVYDFIIYQKTKKSEKMLLQLSKNQKTFIHKVMRTFLKDKQDSLWRLLLAAFVVGFVVSGVEAVCTGQVYLPTIRVILKEAHQYFFKATAYLFIYNLMFIAPLVLVFILTLCGKESATFNEWLKKHLGLSKFLLCCVFLGLLILLIYF